MPFAGLSLALLASPKLGRRASLGLGALGLGALTWGEALPAAVAGLTKLASLAPAQGLLLLVFSWLLVSALVQAPLARAWFRGGALPGLLAGTLAAAGVLCSSLLPPWLSLSLLAVLVTAGALTAPKSDGLPPPVSGAATLRLTLAVGIGAWAVAHLWTALRGWLDPTPLALAACVSVTLVAFSAGKALATLRRTRWEEPLFLAASVLATMACLPVGVAWLEPRLPALLLQHPPTLVLPAVLALPAAVVAVLAGLASPTPRDGRSAAWAPALGAAAGISLGAHLGPSNVPLLPVCAALAGVATLVLGRRAARRIAGVVLAAAPGLAMVLLPPVQTMTLSSGWLTAVQDEQAMGRHRGGLDHSEWSMASWGPEGTTAVRRIDELVVADIDGVPLWPEGRAPTAVRFGADLAALLAGGSDRFVVFGDERGWGSTTLLAHRPTTILVSVSQPELLRTLAAMDPELQRRLLAPQVQLQAVPGRWLLRHAEPQDGILQVALRPWTDVGSGLPSPALFDLASRRLAAGGVYVGVFATDRVASSELRALVSAFAERFPSGMACIPPEGADHLLLVGPRDEGRLDWTRLAERVEARATVVAEVGVRSALDVADRCVFAAPALATWGQGGSERWPPHGLPHTLIQAPKLHLPALAEHLSDPNLIWTLDDHPFAREELAERAESTRHFSSLLGETRTGDIEALFEEAKALRASGHGKEELDTLIAPHIQRARSSMERARKGGVQHAGWQAAISELTVARLLHPDAVEPLLLLALVREARRELRQADSLFQAVLAAQPDHLDAHFGLARVQIARGDPMQAEQTLQEAIEAHPREWSAHQNLGVLLLRSQRYAQAEPVLLEAAALAPDHEAAPQAALAEVYLGQERPSVAMAQAEFAARLKPTAYHHFLVGRCHYELGRYVPAERAFHESVLADPGYYLARGALGQVYALRGDLHQARDAFQAVLIEDPGNEPALRNLESIERLLEAQRTDPGLGAPAP